MEAEGHGAQAASHRLATPVSLEAIPEDCGEGSNDDREVEAAHTPRETGSHSEADAVLRAHPAARDDQRRNTNGTNSNGAKSLFAVQSISQEGGAEGVCRDTQATNTPVDTVRPDFICSAVGRHRD